VCFVDALPYSYDFAFWRRKPIYPTTRFIQNNVEGAGGGIRTLWPVAMSPAQSPLFLWVLWLNIGLVLSVCVVLEGLLLSVDSVFISV